MADFDLKTHLASVLQEHLHVREGYSATHIEGQCATIEELSEALAAYVREHFIEHAEELGMTRIEVSWPKLEGNVEHTQPCAMPDNMGGSEDMHTCGYKRGHFRLYPAERYETTLVVTGPAWEPGPRDQDATHWLVDANKADLTSPEESH